MFLNGNKRMSTLCLLVFLSINEKILNVTTDELTAKALWLSKTSSLDFPVIKVELADWIRTHLVDMPPREQTT
jgi:prophage maintenance system killer protein